MTQFPDGLRTALFLPQYSEDSDGQMHGHGTGVFAIAMTRELARRLGVEARIIGYPTPPEASAAVKTGACDFGFMGIEPSRQAQFDFTPPIFEFDYAFLVPPGSAVSGIGDVDQPGVRVAVMRNHASELALRGRLKHAQAIDAHMPEEAFENLRKGRADVFASPRDVLEGFAPRLPGSRVLDEAYGVNRVGIAVRQGRADVLAIASDFVRDAKASGLVRQIAEGGEVPGYRVAGA